jgi:hypothetical protein
MFYKSIQVVFMDILKDGQICCSILSCYKATLFKDRIELFPLWNPAKGFYCIDLASVTPGQMLPRYYDTVFSAEEWIAFHKMRAA